jgi:WD40 repeat protein
MAVSADGRLVATGMVDGTVHVVSLGSDRVRSFPWEGRPNVRDRAPGRVGFDPAGKWVAAVADGRVFARPLTDKAGSAWRTKSTLGYVRDFAFHPSGHPLAVVDESGHARYLDPATGAVRQSFRWGRTPLYSVAFSPDGLTCAAGTGAGRVVIWDVDG